MADKAKSEIKPFVYIAVGIAAVGGLLFGYDTGAISGAILFIKKQFSLSATMEEIVVSAVLIGAVMGAALGVSCAPKMTPAAGIDFPVKKGGKSDEEAIQ
jgi:SP family galactose:H+ symporter-like MFS transporter